MPEFTVTGARVVVVGAARSGLAAAALLVRRGAQVTLSDVRADIDEARRLEDAGVRLELGSNAPGALAHADLVVTSPGVPSDLPAVAEARRRGVPVIGEMELASRWLRGPIVAITGTKGKSTTTTLVGRMLVSAGRRAVIGGNIGVPLSAQVEDSTAQTVHVIEASSFQLEATDTFRPWIAALLNFSPDHLDRHASEAGYRAAKARVFANQRAEDWAVVNGDDPPALAMAAGSRGQRFDYAVDRIAQAAVFVDRDFIWQRTSEGRVPLVPVSAIRLPGRHMLSNVAAATAISRVAGASGESMARALEGFTGLEHVMEHVGALGGVRFVNDSKATNIDAARRSIESFDRVVAIIGGRYKGGDFGDLAPALTERGRGVIAIGESRPLIRRALADLLPYEEVESMNDAVVRACERARPDGVVLLAPACASFDMFVDYADRGRRFKDAVRELLERKTREDQRTTRAEP
ncbi:MAG: UDP-N-acetylmuramoyl-L-alanine--D-glutamate ligase [Acidobacteriota bacterium]